MTEAKTFATVPLTYGAIISISQPSDENLVVYSEGMIKTQVYLEDITQIGKEASFYRSLFQIYPSFINTYKKEAVSFKANMESKAVGETKLKENLEELKEKLTMEYKFNLEYYEKVKNTPIAFEQSVQFLHLASNKFLACNFKEAEVEKENYKLELEDIPSDATNFKISPSYKHQRDSEGYIYFGDLMFIAHASYFLNKIPYIQCRYQEEGNTSLIRNIYTFETHAHNFGDERVVLDVNKSPDPKNQMNIKQFIKTEINISLEESTRWRINLFAANETELENYLAYGNIIWMNHVESNASMIAKKQDELLTIDFARTIVSDHFQQYVGNTNGMWIIENEEHLVGGPVQSDDKFRLKHFSSGRYLTVVKNPHKKSYHLALEPEKTKDSLFQFVMVYSTDFKSNDIRAKLITKETFTRIKSCSTNNWVSVQLDDDRLEAGLARKPLDDDIFKLLKANNSEIWETSFIISCYPILKDFISFLENLKLNDTSNSKKSLNKVKEAQECIIQLEQFCTNKLLNTSPDQKYGEINTFRQKVLREQYFIEVLTDILRKVFSLQQLEKIFEAKKAEKTLKKTATSHFKTIARKLLSSAPKRENDQQIIEEKTKLCKLIYSLITNICKGNPENELYAYKLIHDFQYHAKFFQEAVDCFISVIGPNQTILSRINEDTDVKEVQREMDEAAGNDSPKKKQVEIFNIKVIFDKKNDKGEYKGQNFVTYFLSLLKGSESIETNRSYLRFLRSICTCKNKGISTNQELLFKIFAEYKELEKSVFLESQTSGGQLEIGLKDSTYISLNDYLKEDNKITNYQNEITYFKEQLKFYCDLLLDRNYLWKNKLEKQFPLKFVFEQIYNASLSLEIRSIFCDLAFTLHIDHEPLNTKVIPNLCRIFKSNHLRNQPSLLTSTEKLQNLDQENFSMLLENLMRIIQNQKEKIAERLQADYASKTEEVVKITPGENFLDNVLLASVIRLLSKMTRFDLLTLLNKKNFYYELVNILLHILEYEKRNPAVSYTLAAVRDDTLPKVVEDKKGNVIDAFGGFMGDLSKGVVGNLKNLANMANSVFGPIQKKKDQGNRNLDRESEESSLFSNPLMKGLIDIKQQLDQLIIDNKKIENENEIIIKEEICHLFSFLIDLRQDFLVSNMISWYDNIVYKFMSAGPGKETVANLVEQDVKKVLPIIPKTGLKKVDDKFSDKLLDGNVLNNMKDILKKSKQKLLNVPKEEGFTKFTEETEVPDLDTLFTQNAKQSDNDTTKPILPSLLTTFYLCNDTNLQDKLLTVIMRMFNQKQELSQNLTDLEVIFQKKNIAAYHKLEAWITNLRLLTETSEIWLDNFVSSKGENTDSVKKVCEILNNIQMLFSKLNPRSAKYYQSRQNMIRNMSGFTPMIELVRDGISHLKKALATPFFPENALQKLFKMFQLIHSCLICFVMNNEANQEILSEHLRLFLSNLELDLGQISLVCEICRDNKLISETFADVIMMHLTDAIISYGHKITFLEPLIVLQSQKGIVLVDNQIKILDQFLPTDNFYKDREMDLLYADDETGQIQFQFQKQKPLDQPFIYHAQLFNILVPQDKASEHLSFVHARLRKIFNIPYCFSLLLQPDNLNTSQSLHTITTKKENPLHKDHLMFDRDSNIEDPQKGYSIIKPKILELMDTLYLQSDKKLAQEFLEHSQALTDFLNIEQNRLKSLHEDSKFDPKLQHYILECLIPFLNSYINKLIKETTEEVRERRGNNVISSFVHVLYEKGHILTQGIPKEKHEGMVELFACYYEDETVKSKVLDKEEAQKPSATPGAGEEEHNIGDFMMDFEDEDDLPQQEKTTFEKYEELWGEFLPHFLSSKNLEKGIKDEKRALSEAIWNFAGIIPEDVRKKFSIDLEERALLKKLIMFLQYGIAHKADKNTMISTLKVLRTIIEDAPDVTEMQNIFDKNDATTMLLSVFSDSKNAIRDDDLLTEFLSFWISLLEGGNIQVQKTIHKFCTVYPKSEEMFAKFHSIIYEQIEYLQMKTTMKNEVNNSQKNIERSGVKSVILEKLLRLLQLFTEGHNLDLQNYLRYQTNSRNRYNMVEAVIELLRIYYEDLVQENYENIVRCLDTLNELVQGPCPENQIVLIDGKFFDVAVGLLSKNIPKEKKKLEDLTFTRDRTATSYLSIAAVAVSRVNKQNKPLERWMLSRLKYKVLILINSLLEMRTSDNVIRRIMRSLPLEILKTNLVKVFRRFRKTYNLAYTMDVLKHFEGDPRERDNDKPVEYFENILETGFLIYFLISSYLEANVQDADLQNEIQEMQEGMANSDQLQDFLKNNVVGQLGRFGYTFLKSGLDSLSVLKKTAEQKLLKGGKEEIIPKEEERKFRKAVEYRQLVTHAMDFFSKNSAHIEVIRNRNIEKVYFIVLPFCKELPQETKDDFNEKVNRQSPQTKVSDLIEKSSDIIKICKHELRLKLFFGRNKVIAVFANFVNLWKDLAFFMTIWLNVLILASYSIRNNLEDSDVENVRLHQPLLFLDDNTNKQTTLSVFLACGIVMAISSVFVVLFFLMKRAPLIFEEAWKDAPTAAGDEPPPKLSLFTLIRKLLRVAYLSLMSLEIVYYIAYGVFAIIGTVIHPFFFAFHLTEILIRYPTLKTVIRAVWEPRQQLALTFLLYLIINYFFSLIGFEFFASQYQGNCETTWLCFLNTFDYTFKSNGGIGGYLDGINEPEKGDYTAGRFFFDYFFNMILCIIMISIVAGIIIDTFGLLREELEDKNNDIQEKCFICGLGKEIFDRQADIGYDFNLHIKKDHYMWNYVFFVAYLEDKDETEYTGIESYVSDKLKKNDFTSWFPFHKALALKSQEENEDDQQREMIGTFQTGIETIKKGLKDVTTIYSGLVTKLSTS